MANPDQEENNIEDEENLAFLPADHHLLAKL
jgi:coiled-coil domain-containing protein 40